MNGNRSIVYREFVGVTPVAKTLRNELRPVGHTQEHIIQNGLIQEDELRQEKSTELENCNTQSGKMQQMRRTDGSSSGMQGLRCLQQENNHQS